MSSRFSCSPLWGLQVSQSPAPRCLELFGQEKRKLKVDLITFYLPFLFSFLPYHLKYDCSKVENDPLSQVESDRMRGNVLKLH